MAVDLGLLADARKELRALAEKAPHLMAHWEGVISHDPADRVTSLDAASIEASVRDLITRVAFTHEVASARAWIWFYEHLAREVLTKHPSFVVAEISALREQEAPFRPTVRGFCQAAAALVAALERDERDRRLKDAELDAAIVRCSHAAGIGLLASDALNALAEQAHHNCDRWQRDRADCYLRFGDSGGDFGCCPQLEGCGVAKLGQTAIPEDEAFPRDASAIAASVSTELDANVREQTGEPLAANEPQSSGSNTFKQVGRRWEVRFDGQSVRLRDLKGFALIRALLQNPHQSLSAITLLGRDSTSIAGADTTHDRTAIEQYKARIVNLEEMRDAAIQRSELEEAGALEEEILQIKQHLVRGRGLGGRPRRLGGDGERARKAARRQYRTAMEELLGECPALHDHLNQSIRTGNEFAYKPQREVIWNT